jgi:type VI protein secretion system component VasK
VLLLLREGGWAWWQWVEIVIAVCWELLLRWVWGLWVVWARHQGHQGPYSSPRPVSMACFYFLVLTNTTIPQHRGLEGWEKRGTERGVLCVGFCAVSDGWAVRSGFFILFLRWRQDESL